MNALNKSKCQSCLAFRFLSQVVKLTLRLSCQQKTIIVLTCPVHQHVYVSSSSVTASKRSSFLLLWRKIMMVFLSSNFPLSIFPFETFSFPKHSAFHIPLISETLKPTHMHTCTSCTVFKSFWLRSYFAFHPHRAVWRILFFTRLL